MALAADLGHRATGRVTFVRRTAIWIPIGVISLLAMPMLVTSRSFGTDWTIHLWLLRQQQLNIESLSRPSLFISVRNVGVFYPMFAFAGSGLYTAGGCLAILLGNRPVLAYKLLYLVGLGCAYGGMTWLSVQLGLRSWRSQIPGVVLVTGAYFITDLAGRGDLGEFAAVSAIPLVIAAGRAVLTSARIRTRDLLAVVGATFLLTGSHNITLLWGSMFVALLAIVCLVAFAPDGLPPVPWARLTALVGAGAVGAGLNAWFLFADLRYGLDTSIARQSQNRVPTISLATPDLLLNPFRPSTPGLSPYARDLRVSLPWMFALWAVVVAVLLWRNLERSSRRLFAGVLGLALVYVTLIVWQTAWNVLPHVLYNLQFPTRLHAYVLLATAVLVLLALLRQASAPEPAKRWTTIVLIAFVGFNVGAATWQVWRVRSEYVRGPYDVVTGKTFVDQVVASRDAAPVSWNPTNEFLDVSTPVITTKPSRVLTVPSADVHGSEFSGVLSVPNGPLPFSTNISAGPRFAKMAGIRAIGRTADDAIVAVRSADEPTTGPIKVTIAQADSPVLEAGAGVSVVSGVLVLALILWGLVNARVRRREPTSRTAAALAARSGARDRGSKPGSS